MRTAERLVARLTDPARGERTVALLLIGYVLVWTLYAALANAGSSISPDMGEALAWSRDLAFGYPKHPPLMAWIAGLWFAVFPLADWAYYLLSMVLAAVTLWFSWAVLGDYLSNEKRVVGLALLTLVPFYNILALNFNADTVQLPFWAATTYWFLRALRTNDTKYAALAGLGAAACMLGKYWSIMLLLGLAAAALVSPHRRDFFRARAPWVTVAVGALAFAPNLVWLWEHDFSPFAYATGKHVTSSFSTVLQRALHYTAVIVGLAAVSAALVALAARPKLSTCAEMRWPSEPERRVTLVAFILPLLLLPLALALIFHVELWVRWAIPAMGLLPVVLLSPGGITLGRKAVTRLVTLAVVFPFVMVGLAPLIAMGFHLRGNERDVFIEQFQLIAQDVDRTWRDTTHLPMRLFASNARKLNGSVFYLADKPSAFDLDAPNDTPWASEERIARDGAALVCWLGDEPCLTAMNALAAKAPLVRTREVDISRQFWGIAGKPMRYRIVIILPRSNG
jgi:4-amino-4-deoxy-L-arabinose transferase-like glycosyltransferase